MRILVTAMVLALTPGAAGAARAQGTANPPAPAAPAPAAAPVAAPPSTTTPVPAAGAPLPVGYVIGPEDVLDVMYWRDKDMSAEVVVRPDGKVALPLLNDVQAAGLTPDELREFLMKASAKFVEDPSVTVVVKTINSRKVFVTGMVAKPGAYPISAPTTVMQVLAMAGGIHEFADAKNIIVMRNEKDGQVAFRFNYKEVLKRKNLAQNIQLKPGDTVVVP